jgi:hypothetical protein
MSQEWAERCIILLIEDKGSKTRFLRPLLQQIRRQGCDYLPTAAQLRICALCGRRMRGGGLRISSVRLLDNKRLTLQ